MDYLLQTVKRDWYDLDFMYLKAHPSFEAFCIYRDTPDIRNTYLDFFSETAFAERRRFILDFYANGAANVAERDTYLSTQDLNRFVSAAADEIARYVRDL